MFAAGKTASAAGAAVNYVEDVFSTWLYTGNGTTQTITNGIDLAGKGGLVWSKSRSSALSHVLVDTVRGSGLNLSSDTTAAQSNPVLSVTSFLADGYTLGSRTGSNDSGVSFASWTFREQPKFFDVVTYTGDGTTKAISHNLGSAPGCIIVKSTSVVDNWFVYHRSLNDNSGNPYFLQLNTTAAQDTGGGAFGTPTSTTFTVKNGATNTSGATYVAYLFAHNAGGFGLTGTDNVVSCGSFTTDGTGAAGNINLGYEAQWLLIKRSDGVGSWNIIDVMRGSSLTSYNYLQPNASTLESNSISLGQGIFPTATGFFVGTNFPAASATYIYVAIRRPMKVPTLGTSVFSPVARTGTGAATTQSVSLNGVDLAFTLPRNAAGNNWVWVDRLRGGAAGAAASIQSNTTAVENNTQSMSVLSSAQTTISYGSNGSNQAATTYIVECFKRAPGFFDEVCYTGNGTTQVITHNLTVVPQLMITKNRNSADYGWPVFRFATGNGVVYLNTTAANAGVGVDWWGNNTIAVEPTSTNFTIGSVGTLNQSTYTYVTYLFATVAGVSKVGIYTGTGALQTIACGFTTGARFVLIKRTNAVGDWYVWDSARGITSGNDPYLLLNSTAAEVTATNYVDTDTTGFKVTAAAPAALNAVGGTYTFLAIA